MAKKQDNIAAILHNVVAWKAVHFVTNERCILIDKMSWNRAREGYRVYCYPVNNE